MKAFGKIFRESFKVDTAWADWFLSRVARNDDLITIKVDGLTVSGALVAPYKMEFHGRRMPVSYINSVATARKYRGRGLATEVMLKALQVSAERGDAFSVLIPATRRLFFFYDTYGFATVFYIDEQRYTSLHEFENTAGFESVEPSWELFHSLEQARRGAVVHNQDDFENILTDLALSDGTVLAVSNGEGRHAMIFFETRESEVHVLDLLATDDVAAEAALNRMRLESPEKSVIVRAVPAAREAELRSRAMARIVNVGAVLTQLAEAHPEVDQVIKVTDRLLPQNSGIYVLRRGSCERVEHTERRVTLDVSVEVLCRILFSDPKIGDVFNLPTSRPFISLMLD